MVSCTHDLGADSRMGSDCVGGNEGRLVRVTTTVNVRRRSLVYASHVRRRRLSAPVVADDQRVAFSGFALRPPPKAYVRTVPGDRAASLVGDSTLPTVVTGWTPDGRAIIVSRAADQRSQHDLWISWVSPTSIGGIWRIGRASGNDRTTRRSLQAPEPRQLHRRGSLIVALWSSPNHALLGREAQNLEPERENLEPRTLRTWNPNVENPRNHEPVEPVEP